MKERRQRKRRRDQLVVCLSHTNELPSLSQSVLSPPSPPPKNNRARPPPTPFADSKISPKEKAGRERERERERRKRSTDGLADGGRGND